MDTPFASEVRLDINTRYYIFCPGLHWLVKSSLFFKIESNAIYSKHMNPEEESRLSRILSHPHFWKVVILFFAIMGGIWAWYHLHVRPAVHAERAQQLEQFQAQQPRPKSTR
jgi:hypothetical protein